jgi:class 3 adenylate cyclase
MPEDRVDRRLAAIFAGDIAGYGRLMGVDEEGTLRQLKAHRKELVDPKITEHRGRIVKTTGDGMLVEFVSVVDAVRCAVDIQRGMAARNSDLPPDRRIEFRVGINVGDIISDTNDIYGDGVNVAARLQALAEPGGIMVSRTVHNQVRDKLSFGFKDMGEQPVKNIARPIGVYQVSLIENTAPITVKDAHLRNDRHARRPWAKDKNCRRSGRGRERLSSVIHCGPRGSDQLRIDIRRRNGSARARSDSPRSCSQGRGTNCPGVGRRNRRGDPEHLQCDPQLRRGRRCRGVGSTIQGARSAARAAGSRHPNRTEHRSHMDADRAGRRNAQRLLTDYLQSMGYLQAAYRKADLQAQGTCSLNCLGTAVTHLQVQELLATDGEGVAVVKSIA